MPDRIWPEAAGDELVGVLRAITDDKLKVETKEGLFLIESRPRISRILDYAAASVGDVVWLRYEPARKAEYLGGVVPQGMSIDRGRA